MSAQISEPLQQNQTSSSSSSNNNNNNNRIKFVSGTPSQRSQLREDGHPNPHPGTTYNEHFQYPPPAPEVPRGPSISYRQAYVGTIPEQPLTRSFSQRAKGQMLAQEALEDDEYWDDHDDIASQRRRSEGLSNNAGWGYGASAAQNGVSSMRRDSEIRRATKEKQPQLPLFDSPQSTPKASRHRPHSLRHSADVAPLNSEASSPSTKLNPARGPKPISEAQRRDWAPDRSPLQTLEVKLNDISKEEKRARVEEAEMLLREAKAGRSGRRASKDGPTASKHGPSMRNSSLTPAGAEESGLDRNPTPKERRKMHRNALVEPQQEDVHPVYGNSRGALHGQEQQVAGKPVTVPAVQFPEHSVSAPQSSWAGRRAEPAQGLFETVPFRKPPPDSIPQSRNAGSAYPVRDARRPDDVRAPLNDPTIQSDIQSTRLQSEVRQATSMTQAPVASSIPSNNTRAVSTRENQPQPLFHDERDISKSGPLRESNSSHKAALVEATAAVGAAGATAATSIRHEGSKKLQKAPPANAKLMTYSGETRPIPPSTETTQNSTSTEAPRSGTNTSTQESMVEFYYRGMPKQVDVQKSNPQRAPEPAEVSFPEPNIAGQNNNNNNNNNNNATGRPRRTSVSFKVPFDKARPVNEWKHAGTARLTLTDLALDSPGEQDQAWWEINGSSGHRRGKLSSGTAQVSGVYSQLEGPKRPEFRPPLYLKCGPLLRYTGMRRERAGTQSGQAKSASDREVWRGSVMIVTHDAQSSYEEVPTLRLFSQPRDLLPPPPEQVQGDDLAPEYVDPIAGLAKVSRRGQTLYVKPVDHLEEGKDLSWIENEDGLFETSPSPLDNSTQVSATANKRMRGQDGESLGKYKEVQGARLYADIERGVTFWRFNIEVELGDHQAHIAYRINHGASMGFWVPAKGQTMNIMFHSCNGFSLSVDPNHFSGPDPLWRDVLNTHQTRPFHVMIGGGDQIYNDRVMVDTQHFAAWTNLKNPAEKHHAPFTDAMREELESFYLKRYAMWFSQGLFGLANSQIPMVNIYDDHDIIDGFGSYPDEFQRAPVFMGIGNVAFKYYMLFQHQSVPEETQADEPSWLLGAHPGPYIQQLSRSVFVNLGKSVAFLGLDCRTERERYSVLTDDTYEIVLERCRREIEEGETKHLLVLLGVPIAYPRLVWLENLLTSRAMTPMKALGRAKILKGGFLNKFDGGVEVLDDLDDHWTATGHKEERNNLVHDLQELAAEKSIRITILGGDVHLGAIGQFYSNPKLRIPKDRDHRYIPNIISSAIVNTPPPEMLADTLNKRNKTHHLDEYTVEDMIPMFTHDVDGRRRNNKRLLPRRNWCSIREYHPGSTPPPTPPESPIPSEQHSESEDYPRRRRFSFSRDDANPRKLLRRLSQRGAPPSSYRDEMISSPLDSRRASHDGYFPNPQQPQTAPATRTSFSTNDRTQNVPQTAPPNRTSFNATTPVTATAAYNQRASVDALPSAPDPRPGIFRRPTNLSEKAAKKGGPPPTYDSQGNLITENLNDHVNLEGGLDITLNCEISQGDPAGITTPYRLLIPALQYDGSSDSQKLDRPDLQRKPTLLKKMGFGRTGNRSVADRQGEGNWGQPSESGSESRSDGQYSGSEDEYYEKKRRPSVIGAGGLKRWFSGRKDRRTDGLPPPQYEQGLGPLSPQQQQQQQQQQPPLSARTAELQGQPDFAGKEVRTTPFSPQSPSSAIRGGSVTGTGNGSSYTHSRVTQNPPAQTQHMEPEPFPSQARGKAARLLGVDSGPATRTIAKPQSQPAQATRVVPLQQQQRQQPPPPPIPDATGPIGLNQSQPLPPPSRSNTLPLPNVGARSTGHSAAGGGMTGYANYDLGQPQSFPQEFAGRATGHEQVHRRNSGSAIKGYSGVEAWKDKRGGGLRRFF